MVADGVALITGAASGIGASAARRFHRRGSSVVLIDVNESGLASLTDELGDTRSLAVAADVTDFDAVGAAVAAGVARFGGMDAVVANAGVGSWVSMLEMSAEEFRRVIDVNVTGVFHTVRATSPALIEHAGSGATFVRSCWTRSISLPPGGSSLNWLPLTSLRSTTRPPPFVNTAMATLSRPS